MGGGQSTRRLIGWWPQRWRGIGGAKVRRTLPDVLDIVSIMIKVSQEESRTPLSSPSMDIC